MKIKRRRKSDDIKRTVDFALEVYEEDKEGSYLKVKTVSTGSTLLDLAISGGRIKGGGIPGGVLVEIYGPSSSGKTAILAELCASAQTRGGEVRFLDPEGRLDQEYCRIYGLSLPEDEYFMPDTVEEVFQFVKKWTPSSKDFVNVLAVDSLAALSTELEMEKKDSYGMKRAKDFSQGLRQICRKIKQNNWLLAASNQIRQGDMGEVTPGGKAIAFYSSLRIRVHQVKPISVSKKVREKKIDKIIGIESECIIKKSSIDDPFRKVPIYIIFGFGIDDVRGNLQWYKDMTGETKYNCFEESFQSVNHAIKYIEDNDFEKKLKERTVNLWKEMEDKFKTGRREKVRE